MGLPILGVIVVAQAGGFGNLSARVSKRFALVLGVAIIVTQKDMDLLTSLVYAISTALGFTMALVLFAGIRTRLALTDVPAPMRGVPVALIVAGLLAMAFMGFAGIQIG